MSSRIVELTENQSVTLGLITRYKCISPAEMAHWSTLSEAEIEGAIPGLLKEHLIFLSPGGLPKRYCPRPVSTHAKDEPEDSDQDNPDILYEAEAVDPTV